MRVSVQSFLSAPGSSEIPDDEAPARDHFHHVGNDRGAEARHGFLLPCSRYEAAFLVPAEAPLLVSAHIARLSLYLFEPVLPLVQVR